LTSIGGFAALLQNPDLDAATRSHYLEIIEAESKRLSQLSDNLLKLSALQDSEAALAREPIMLDEQLAAVAAMLEPQLQAKELELRTDLAPVMLQGDRELLDLVWINLLQNACKYTPCGGTVTVTLTTSGDHAVASIADTGIGMSQPELLHVFERFYRADKSRSRAEGGNGLGLALVKEIVEAHGGRVTATSQPGEGSTFTVELPL
ncbi:MAG: HAMP domain-containing histidine kinase, partial [Coriobacteriia bacterium]|nr:HAMP domain-containing histidine kinase [Coriobacteriia bacterium]